MSNSHCLHHKTRRMAIKITQSSPSYIMHHSGNRSQILFHIASFRSINEKKKKKMGKITCVNIHDIWRMFKMAFEVTSDKYAWMGANRLSISLHAWHAWACHKAQTHTHTLRHTWQRTHAMLAGLEAIFMWIYAEAGVKTQNGVVTGSTELLGGRQCVVAHHSCGKLRH